MNLEEIKQLVDQLLREYGYTRNFPIRINNRLTRARGRVTFNLAHNDPVVSMEFSQYLMNCSRESIEGTVRHEVAHVIVLYKTHRDHHHDEVWKQWAVKLGADPSATTKDENYSRQINKYFVYCHDCGQLLTTTRKASKFVKYPERYMTTCCKAHLDVDTVERRIVEVKEIKFTETKFRQLGFDF